jgi:plastocyanin
MWQGRLMVAAMVCIAAFLPGDAFTDSHTSTQEKARICAKAKKRYQKLFGKPPAEEGISVVMMHKYTFCPSNITVKQGETVRWVNVDKRTSHSVWFKQLGKPESDRLFGEEQIEMTLDQAPGTYAYLCGPHWKDEGMVATVTVTP